MRDLPESTRTRPAEPAWSRAERAAEAPSEALDDAWDRLYFGFSVRDEHGRRVHPISARLRLVLPPFYTAGGAS